MTLNLDGEFYDRACASEPSIFEQTSPVPRKRSNSNEKEEIYFIKYLLIPVLQKRAHHVERQSLSTNRLRHSIP